MSQKVKRNIFLSILSILINFSGFTAPDTAIYVDKIAYYKEFIANSENTPDSAYSMAKRGLELAKAASDTSAMYDFWVSIAEIQKEQNNFEKSHEAFQSALTLINTVDDKQQYAAVKKKTGALYWKFSQYKNAANSFNEALIVYQQLGDALEVGKTFNNLGTISREVSSFDSAIYYYNKALKLFQKTNEKKWVASTYQLIGNTYLQFSKTSTARNYYKKALSLRRELADSIAMSKSLTNIALSYKKERKMEKSLNFFRQALEIRQNMNNMPLVAASLNDIGGLYRSVGNYGEAIEYFQRALVIRRQNADQMKIASSLLNVGSIYKELDLPETALEYYTQALEIYQVLGDEIRISISLNYIGGVYYKQGAYDHALDYYLSALGYREVTGDKTQIARIMNNIAMIYKNMGNYEKSLEYYKNALTNYKTLHNQKRFAATQNHIGNLFIVQQEYDKALKWLKKAYFLRQEINDNFGFAHSALDIANVFLLQKNNAAAMAFLGKALTSAKKLDNFQLLRDIYYALYKATRYKGNKGPALRFHEKYTAWKDSVFNHQTLERITKVQMQNEAERTRMKIAYENEQKEKEISRLKKNRQEREKYFQLKVEAERNARNLIIVIAASLLIVLILLVNRFMIKSKANRRLKIVNDELSDINQKLQESQKELKQLNATKDKFFSIIAHDLKNPFTALVSLTEILSAKSEDLKPERRKEIIDQISNASRSTYRLLDNLLEWSRTQQGKILYKPEAVNLFDVTREVVDLQLNTLEQKRQNINLQVDTDLVIKADNHMLSFVIRNLIGNAIKFTPLGGEISVTAKKGSREAIVKVSDTGVGMTRTVIDKLFDLNTHYTTEGTNKEKGVGLGLILCKEFVEQMDGGIFVESTPGNGSTFAFSLPLV